MKHIHDSLLLKKNFQEILFYMIIKGKLFLVIVFLYLRNPLKTNSLLLEDILRIRIILINHNIAHVHHLLVKLVELPHILIGDSNSKNAGCSKKISLDFTQSHFISASVNWTNLFGL